MNIYDRGSSVFVARRQAAAGVDVVVTRPGFPLFQFSGTVALESVAFVEQPDSLASVPGEWAQCIITAEQTDAWGPKPGDMVQVVGSDRLYEVPRVRADGPVVDTSNAFYSIVRLIRRIQA